MIPDDSRLKTRGLLLEAAVLASADQTTSIRALATSPMLYPFDVGAGLERLRRSGRFDVHNEVMDLEIVSLRM